MFDQKLLQFGIIISIEGRLYVFLAKTSSAVYLAEIIGGEQALQLRNLRNAMERRAAEGDVRASDRLKKSQLYVFVELSTEEFNDSIISLYRCQYSDNELNKTDNFIKRLNENDLLNLKKEIEDGDFPEDLKEKIR